MTTDKLHISNEMLQLDSKNRDFYDQLTEEERKKFSTFLMLRWSSGVTDALNYYDKKDRYLVADSDIQAYYVMCCNERLNTNFFDIAKHPKLQWMLATSVSPGIGKFKHEWIKNKKRGGDTSNKTLNFLRELYPHLKEDEIELLGSINDKDDIKQLARQHGWDDKRIKTDL